MAIRELRIGAAAAAACFVWSVASAQAQQPLPPNQPAAQAGQAPGNSDPAVKELANRPTPKTPDGRPDLNGVWFSYTGSMPAQFGSKKSGGSVAVVGTSKGSPEVFAAAYKRTANPPQYKPEFQAKLKEMQAKNLNYADKVFICGQPGLPRVGAPQQIVQQSKQFVFLYADLNGMVFRVIPIGGPYRDTDASYYGVSVAHWEGDILVVETHNLSTDTWIGEEGFFHSDQLRIVERLRRAGDTIEYNVVAEDPAVLEKPWVKPMYILQKTDTALEEPYPCDYENREGFDTPRHDQRTK